MSTSKPNGSNGNRGAPLSLEELLKSKAKERDESDKPKFLTKEERAKLALQKRAEEIEAKKRQQESERSERSQFFKEADALARAQEAERMRKNEQQWGGYGGRGRGRGRGYGYGYGGRGRGRGGYGGYQDDGRYGDGSLNENDDDVRKRAEKIADEKLKEKELQAIRDRYMGVEQTKRKIRRMNDKKFVFDWDKKEDTSYDFDPLYAQRKEFTLFGRAHIGGFEKQQNGTKKVEGKVEDKSLGGWDDRHWSEKSLEDMKERDWRIFKEDHNISTKGGNIPNPLRFWHESTIPAQVLRIIQAVGYTTPTPIQRATIPLGLQNRDIIGVAETGSGKTASFLIPMLAFIMEMPKLDESRAADGPYALVMAPTRELAQQIETEAHKFARPLGVGCVSIVGGHTIEEQAFALRNGAEIIIATPGRLRDILERRILVLNQCTYVVMDEADRMIDMGFENDVNFILDQLPVSNVKPDTDEAEDPGKLLEGVAKSSETEGQDGTDGTAMNLDEPEVPEPKETEQNGEIGDQQQGVVGQGEDEEEETDEKGRPIMKADRALLRTALVEKGIMKKYRQTTMFSATMPPAVERLARKYLRRPAVVTIGSAGQAVDTVVQEVELISDEAKKRSRLSELLSQYEPPIIVFLNIKKAVDTLAKSIQKEGYKVTAIHGGKSQEQREYALSQLKTGAADVLVATDVAGRGIDVPNVSLVVNYDMAKNIEGLFLSFLFLSIFPKCLFFSGCNVDYTHRIGRTGRAGKSGTAISFVNLTTDTDILYDLKLMLQKSSVSKCPPELASHEAAQGKGRVVKRKFEEVLFAK
ncbi:P-loop containing nucleoside triphosphate hydrolase protein [Paraphysoderma sedebokerense]|nr:P-loop containing nucleoside triphosphate hydrolase protein [Paraphysoderma sedebokerense]